MGWRRVPVSFAVLMLMAGASSPADTEGDRATLRGLKGIQVVVDPPPPELEREGLDRDHLRARIEQRLRDGEIPTHDSVEFLGLSISTAHSGKRSSLSLRTSLSVVVNLGVYQVVTLNRDKATKTVAETWSDQRILSTSARSVADSVAAALDELTDDFTKAYRSVNPKIENN